MLARILFVTDLHKRCKESASIKNSIAVQNLIQEDIIAFCEQHGITHIISAGDWYDRGFHGLAQAYGSIEMDRRISAAVNGEVYLCVGNHFYLERDENPEMYIIQPNELITPSVQIPVPETPIFKVVRRLVIGTVQINFFHFQRIGKNYTAERLPNTTFNIGIYHDDAVVPGYIRELDGFTGKPSTNKYLSNTYAGIDLALHGHIHSKHGMVTFTCEDGTKVPLCIPGALCIYSNKESCKHADVQLPVIEINDDSTVSMKLATFSTHIDMLRFYDTAKKKRENNKRNSLEIAENMYGNTTLQSLNQYLLNLGYNDKQMRIINTAANNVLTIPTAVTALMEEANGNQDSTAASADEAS